MGKALGRIVGLQVGLDGLEVTVNEGANVVGLGVGFGVTINVGIIVVGPADGLIVGEVARTGTTHTYHMASSNKYQYRNCFVCELALLSLWNGGAGSIGALSPFCGETVVATRMPIP